MRDDIGSCLGYALFVLAVIVLILLLFGAQPITPVR